ncbi:AAA family ATPase [Geomobilimonas luticola]|uniref:RecF/RecN/SMC N-terminal domain-containing protein n=1 Tax=Geomobilimonas luticola TaxID=1114878 RepID=A0ABS5S8R7_9BACT|nr:AAA family ATPase [Geomobilimonas luticola]MBT0651545.1 hypothetical protein [Geomobilimonas luticola]
MKISKIELKDFRGFPAPEVFDLAGGKNLLLYGENGSGKSSLYKALVEFLNLDPKAQPFHKHRNIFSAGPDKSCIDGHVSLELSDGTLHVWHCLGSRPHGDRTLPQATRERWVDTARRASLLEYRSLLQTNFNVADVREKLFELAVTTLLANVPIVGTGGRVRSLSQLWADFRGSKPKRRTRNQLRQLAAAEKEFNDGFSGILPDVQRAVTEILRYFTGAGLEIRLDVPTVHYDCTPHYSRDWGFKNKFLDFEVELNGVQIPDWNTFLNEARLSALAISLYLAGAILSNPRPPASVATPTKLLVLDDVLIGLDLSNRLPVLRILEERFADYQVILLTHDHVWFEMAQLALMNPTQWTVYEMHRQKVKEGTFVFDAPVLKPQTEKLAEHFLLLAEEHLNVKHDLRTAALHARAAFEVKLKSYCSKRKIQVPYDLEGRHLNTDHFLLGIERRLLWDGKMPKSLFTLQRIKLFRSGVLNPLAHFHPVTLAPGEVDAAIQAVKKLDFADGTTNFAKNTFDLLQKPTPTSEELLDAACWLRTTFEVDLRGLLKRYDGKVTFRDDWTKFTLAELWESAKEAMNRVNAAVAAPLIADIEAQRSIFLDDWNYALVNTFDKPTLDAAWNVLRTPPPETVQTRLAAFT